MLEWLMLFTGNVFALMVHTEVFISPYIHCTYIHKGGYKYRSFVKALMYFYLAGKWAQEIKTENKKQSVKTHHFCLSRQVQEPLVTGGEGLVFTFIFHSLKKKCLIFWNLHQRFSVRIFFTKNYFSLPWKSTISQSTLYNFKNWCKVEKVERKLSL